MNRTATIRAKQIVIDTFYVIARGWFGDLNFESTIIFSGILLYVCHNSDSFDYI